MSSMNFPSYPKEMREHAKREGKYLVTVDIVRPNGKREISAQGPWTRDQAKAVCDVLMKVLTERGAGQEPREAGGGGE